MTPIRVAQIMGKMRGGGVESVVMNYYRHVDRGRVQFDFIVDADSTEVPHEEIEALGGRVLVVPPYQQLHRYVPAMAGVLGSSRYRAIHAHLNTLSVFPLAVAWAVGVPVRIAHSHSTAGGREALRNAMKHMLRPCAKVFATHYVACSERAGAWLYGARASRDGAVRVLPNAIEIRRFVFDPDVRVSARGALGLNDHFVIGHVGRFSKQKNHSFLIDVFAAVLEREPSAVLLLAGDGELKSQIQDKVASLGLTDHVRFLGLRADVADLYQAMDVFVLPSFYEGYPVVGVESQISGLPCVYSENVGRDSRLLRTTRFLALDEDPACWASAVLAARGDTGRSERSTAVRDASLDVEQTAEQLVSIYEEAVGGEQ